MRWAAEETEKWLRFSTVLHPIGVAHDTLLWLIDAVIEVIGDWC